MKRSSHNIIMVLFNIALISAIGIIAFKGGVSLTGFAVAGNETGLSAYRVSLNVTDKDTGEQSSVLFAGKTVFFVNSTIKDYNEKNLVEEDASTIYSDKSVCKSLIFRQKKYLYDGNLNGKYDPGEQYIYSVETDDEGCLVADIPEGYKAMLTL